MMYIRADHMEKRSCDVFARLLVIDEVTEHKDGSSDHPDANKGIQVREVQMRSICMIGCKETVNFRLYLINSQFDHMGQLQGKEDAHDAE